MKKFFFGHPYSILSVILLALSLAGTVYLVQTNQDIRNKAANTGTCSCYADAKDYNHCSSDGYFNYTCPNGSGTITCMGTKNCPTNGEVPTPTGIAVRPCNKAGGDQCCPGETICQGAPSSKTGYLCNCVGAQLNGQQAYVWSCNTQNTTTCPPDITTGTGVGFLTGCPTGQTFRKEGDCIKSDKPFTVSLYKCPNQLNMSSTGCNINGVVLTGQSSYCFNTSGFCGTMQMDVQGGTSGACGIDWESNPTCLPPTSVPVKSTNTPSPTRIPTPSNTIKPTNTPTRTPTPTNTIRPSNTPTGTLKPTNTPTRTPTPTNTPVFTSTPKPVALTCAQSPCSQTSPCATGLVCTLAENGISYCSKPEYQTSCSNQPNYTNCCTAPIAEAPSPTRITLPSAGIDFPVKTITIVGTIVTLLGILVLL